MTNSSNKCDPPFRCQNQRVTTTTMEPPQLAVLHPQLAMQHPEAQPQRRASSNSNNPAPAVCPGKFIVPEFPELAINKLTHHFVFVWSIARRAIRMPAGLADCGTSFRWSRKIKWYYRMTRIRQLFGIRSANAGPIPRAMPMKQNRLNRRQRWAIWAWVCQQRRRHQHSIHWAPCPRQLPRPICCHSNKVRTSCQTMPIMSTRISWSTIIPAMRHQQHRQRLVLAQREQQQQREQGEQREQRRPAAHSPNFNRTCSKLNAIAVGLTNADAQQHINEQHNHAQLQRWRTPMLMSLIHRARPWAQRHRLCWRPLWLRWPCRRAASLCLAQCPHNNSSSSPNRSSECACFKLVLYIYMYI